MLPLVAFFPGCNCSGSGSGEEGLNSYSVKFYTNSDKSHTYSVQTVVHGHTASPPAEGDPQKDGCSFVGWYKDMELTMIWKFESDKVYGDTTLFAKFEKNN